MELNEFETLENTILENLPGQTKVWVTLSNWVSAWRTAKETGADWSPKTTIEQWLEGLHVCWVGVLFMDENNDPNIETEYHNAFRALKREAHRLNVQTNLRPNVTI